MKCKTCEFYEKQMNMVDLRNPVGKCHRYPPQSFPIQTQQGHGSIPLWSVVGDDEWCGEYRPKLVEQ